MSLRKSVENPGWCDLKPILGKLDHNGRLKLIQDLYAASRDNQSFLNARFGLAADVTSPFKATISHRVCPDVTRSQNISVSKAKKAISDYRKATGDLQGMAELTVFYCESCTDFLNYCGMDDVGYFNALVGMFAQALKTVGQLDPDFMPPFVERLETVRREGHNYGYWVGETMDDLMKESGLGGK
ncbi:MAG: hypothetical protein VST70_06465 [Nitrospirota bacterium]|nr:hypothetical protein [Nitrospirota bacterium]